MSRRDYPLFPVWDGLPIFAPGISALVALLLIGILVWMVLRPERWNVALFLVLILFLALQDQSRWQPWVYQYTLMLLPILFLKRKVEPLRPRSAGKGKGGMARTPLPYHKSDSCKALGLLQFIVVMVYLWGGIHKCQGGWLSVWESSLIAPLLSDSGEKLFDALLVGFGYAVPAIEILMALGLLFKRWRIHSVIVITVTHLTILILLGPVKGSISNSVVWPWNGVMIGMVFLLFWKQEGFILEAFKPKTLISLSALVMCLMTVAPMLFYFGLWDRYLSFSLYAGQQKRFLVQVPAEALDHIPDPWKPYLMDPKAKDGHQVLSPGTWSSKELNVPLISEWRILRSFSEKLCSEDLAGAEIRFYVDHRHLPDKPKQYFYCQEVEKMR